MRLIVDSYVVTCTLEEKSCALFRSNLLTVPKIQLNGINIRKYNYYGYMQLFSVVFQDFKLLSFGLGHNRDQMHFQNTKEGTIYKNCWAVLSNMELRFIGISS